MPEISVDVEVYCSCGEGLCRQTTSGQTRGRGQPFFEVQPCENCLEKARDEGKDKGYREGYDEAEKEFSKNSQTGEKT